jgi:TfoX/Sxy family transcriptional regulator of competence genes
MNDRDELASRVRALVGADPGVSEKSMFGGIGYFVNSNMFLGVTSKGELMARYGKADEAHARALPGADAIDFETKKMAGFLVVNRDAIEDDAQLENWVRLCLGYAATLPPKIKKVRG